MMMRIMAQAVPVSAGAVMPTNSELPITLNYAALALAGDKSVVPQVRVYCDPATYQNCASIE